MMLSPRTEINESTNPALEKEIKKVLRIGKRKKSIDINNVFLINNKYRITTNTSYNIKSFIFSRVKI